MRQQRLIAVTLSVLLWHASTVAPVALTALAASGKGIPTLKTSIENNNRVVELTLGKATVVHLNSPASRVSISDPQVVGIVVLSPTEVELIGKTVGVANLLVWGSGDNTDYLTIDLSVHRDVSTLARKIQMIDPGINIVPVAAEDSVILTGVAESLDKAQLAYDLAKAFFTADSGSSTAGTGNEPSSNSPGSSSQTSSTIKIINLIRVIGQPGTKAEMVQEQLKTIDPNIKLGIVPGFGGKEKAILTGRVKNASMVAKAVNLTSVFYGTPGVKLLAGPGGNLVKEGKDSDGGNFQAGEGGELIGNLAGNMLHGMVMTDSSGNVISMLEVDERPQVRCNIKFIEIRRTNVQAWNPAALLATHRAVVVTSYKGWNDLVADPDTGIRTVTPGSIVSTVVQGATSNNAQAGLLFGRDFGAVLNGVANKGNAKILAEPTITAISGEPAAFISGGEFPIPVIGPNGAISVVFKEFGIRLNLLSTVTERGTIHMQVSPEVSDLDRANGVNLNGITIPALRTRRSKAVVEMHDGDNFVLSGLYNKADSTTLTQTPILGQIPILGNLFRSTDFQRGETELIVVIHPEIKWDMNVSAVENARNAPRAASAPVSQDPDIAAAQAGSSEIRQVTRLSTDDVNQALGTRSTSEKSIQPGGAAAQPSVLQSAPKQLSESFRQERGKRWFGRKKTPVSSNFRTVDQGRDEIRPQRPYTGQYTTDNTYLLQQKNDLTQVIENLTRSHEDTTTGSPVETSDETTPRQLIPENHESTLPASTETPVSQPVRPPVAVLAAPNAKPAAMSPETATPASTMPTADVGRRIGSLALKAPNLADKPAKSPSAAMTTTPAGKPLASRPRTTRSTATALPQVAFNFLMWQQHLGHWLGNKR